MKTYALIAFLPLAFAPFCTASADPPCPRFEPGSAVQEPENLYARNGCWMSGSVIEPGWTVPVKRCTASSTRMARNRLRFTFTQATTW